MNTERLYVIVQRIKYPWIPFLWYKKEPPIAVTTGEALGFSLFRYRWTPKRCMIVARTRKEALEKFYDGKRWPDEKLHREGQQYLGTDC